MLPHLPRKWLGFRRVFEQECELSLLPRSRMDLTRLLTNKFKDLNMRPIKEQK